MAGLQVSGFDKDVLEAAANTLPLGVAGAHSPAYERHAYCAVERAVRQIRARCHFCTALRVAVFVFLAPRARCSRGSCLGLAKSTHSRRRGATERPHIGGCKGGGSSRASPSSTSRSWRAGPRR